MKKKITIYVDDSINSLMNVESKNKNISINRLTNNVLAMYYKQKIQNDNSFFDTEEERIINDISGSLRKIHQQVLYSNHLLNGGLPIFTTNTDTLILKPTEKLKSEAKKKTALSYASFLKNGMSKEDYFSIDNDDTD